MSHNITLSDRIKELVQTTGTVPFDLDQGAATGFSPFEDFYSSGDAVFYAATDGTSYEVGSGQYRKDSVGTETLTRFPFRSSNSNNLVSFTAGVKEVYVTYPGKYAVFTGSGIGTYEEPKASGLAFWESSQILNYDGNIVWDTSSNFLGVSTATPQFPIDVGGSKQYSQIRASGFLDGGSGVLFAGGTTMDTGMTASGGRQLEPFIRNILATDTNADELLDLSGVVDQAIMLNTQPKGTVFAGPASGCGCDPTYPTFRYLTIDDLPYDDKYVRQHNDDGPNQDGAIAIYHESGAIKYDNAFVIKDGTDRLGVNTASPNATLDVFGDVKISGAVSSVLVLDVGMEPSNTHIKIGAENPTHLTDSYSTTIGYAAGSGASVITYSDLIGLQAGTGCSYISYTSMLGPLAGNLATGVAYSNFIGTQAGAGADDVTRLNAIGRYAGTFASGCSNSNMMGFYAGYQVIDSEDINMIGTQAGYGASECDYSNVIGYQAGYQAKELNYSEAIGYKAGYQASGDRNIFVGDNSGYEASGDYNVFIGKGAGYKLNTGSNNIEIVSNGSTVSETVMVGLSNKININDVVHGDSSTKRLVVGNVALTDYTPNSTLEVKPQNATDVGFIVEGAASQTADLAQWRDVDDNVNVAYITADGSIKSSGTVSASGGILFNNLVPNVTTNALYNQGGVLKFNGATVGDSTAYVVKFSDGKSATDAITSADTTHVSGVSGIEVRYSTSSTNNYFTIGASGLSGVLYDYTSDVSGVMRSEITSISTAGWSLQDGLSDQAADGIANDDIVTISGVSGIDTQYTPATQHMVISASGLSGVMQTQIDTLGAGGGTVQAGSGLIMVGTEINMDVNGSGQLEHLIFNDDQIRIGRDAGTHLDELGLEFGFGAGSYWNAIGYQAGYQASGVSNVDFIGYQAGYQSSGIQSTILLGQLAGYKAKNILGGVLIGSMAGRESTCEDDSSVIFIGGNAGNQSNGIDESIFLGVYAGYGASGIDNSSFVGYKAGYVASGVDDSHFAGREAGYQSSGISDSNFIGYKAGYQATGIDNSNFIGNQAGYKATGCDDITALGRQAGSYLLNTDNTNIIGTNAGYSSSGCEQSSMIGDYAGAYSSGCYYSNMIGSSAGYESSGCMWSNIIGSGAGRWMKNSYHMDVMGSFAGSEAVDNLRSIMIGYSAGNRASGIRDSVMIGDKAGITASGGGNHIMIGYEAGGGLWYGDASVESNSSCGGVGILIGFRAGLFLHTSSDNVILGTYAAENDPGVAGSHSYRVDSGGNFEDCVAIGTRAAQAADNLNSTVMIGTTAGWESDSSTNDIFIGVSAGLRINSVTHDPATTSSSNNIMIGTRAGEHADGSNRCIYLGYYAGRYRNSDDSLIIKTNSSVTENGADWSDDDDDGVIDIAQIVRGISTGADTDSTGHVRTLRIGAKPTNTAELTNVCLGVKAQQSADTVLKLIPATSQSAPQLESVTAGFDNTVITNNGRLKMPMATVFSVPMSILIDENSQIIEHEDGIVAILSHGGNLYQVVSFSAQWWTNTNTGALVVLTSVI